MPKSRTGSYGSARLRAAVAGCAPESSTSVWPSGGDFASASFASSPAPPGRFSTTTGWPRRSESFCPRRRLTRSLPEPGGEPTRKRTGLTGYVCEIVSPVASAASAASIAAANLMFISRASKDSARVRIQLESSMQLRKSREADMAHVRSTFTRRRFIQAAGAGSVALAGLGFSRESRAQAVKPNIVFILADDLGYADVSCYGQRDYTTLNVDRLAIEGLKLTQGYSNSASCSPTRTGLITGRYQMRLPVGLEEPINATTPKGVGLPPSHPTLPSLLKKVGYGTTLVGKWHLGFLPKFGPLKSGYDHFYGFRGGAVDYYSHNGTDQKEDLWDDDVQVHQMGYLTDVLGSRAVDAVDSYGKSGQPFLLSLHFNAPHWPWEAPGDEAESERLRQAGSGRLADFDGGSQKTYQRMIEEMDKQIGHVLQALHAK